jgi:hypothetical protein
MAIISGCSTAPFRTGSVVIDKFDTSKYRTSNPVFIKADVADYVREHLHDGLRQYLLQDSKLTIAENCSSGDYRLVGRIKEINTDVESHYRFVTVTVNNNFEIDAEGELVSCKSGDKIAEFSVSKDEDRMDKAVDELAEKIVAKIRRDPTLIPPPEASQPGPQ